MLELYHNDMSVCAQKVRIVLAEKNLEWQGPNLNLRAGEQFAPGFVKISPKAVVPVLVHDGRVFNESNAIVEYLDEVFPDPPLMPDNAADRALVRKWLIQLDANLHVDVATISFAIAFRHQVLAVNDTPEKLQAFIDRIPDPRRALLLEGMVSQGLDYPGVIPAIKAYDKLLSEMELALAESDWLVGGRMSLADIGYVPYITRLAHLQLAPWWDNRPRVADWYRRMCDLPSYRQGLVAWNKPAYLEVMAEKGREAWPRVAQMLDR